MSGFLGRLKTTHYASVLELVYRLVPKTSVERLAGSEPARSTRTVVGPTVSFPLFLCRVWQFSFGVLLLKTAFYIEDVV